MQRYKLFAARDGEIVEESFRAPDDEEARVIAAHRIVEAFGLDFLEDREFDDVIAETDGATLDLDFDPEVPEVLAAWACAQLQFLSQLRDRCGKDLAAEMKGCNSALLRLVQAVDNLTSPGGG